MFDTTAFGTLIRRKRKAIGMSQAVLAERMFHDAVRSGDISRIEGGIHMPNDETIQKLCIFLDISAVDMAPVSQPPAMLAQLDDIPDLSRDALENLSVRFGAPDIAAASDATLRAYLVQKRAEFRSCIDILQDLELQISNHVRISDAARNFDFDRVETLLTQVGLMDDDLAVETKEARARSALLVNRPKRAFKIFTSIADSFRDSDLLEYADRCHAYARQLADHGKLGGGFSLRLAADMLRPAMTVLATTDYCIQWATLTHQLGQILDALCIQTRGPEGRDIAAQAVAAYRDTLTVFTRDYDAKTWAATMQNLATALHTQGCKTDGPDATNLLEEAVKTYHAALEISTRPTYPVHWAIMQERIAITERERALRADATRAACHWAAALEHVDSALAVYDPYKTPLWHVSATRLRSDILAHS